MVREQRVDSFYSKLGQSAISCSSSPFPYSSSLQSLTSTHFVLSKSSSTFNSISMLSNRMKPLLCACLSQEPNKVLIVGVCGKPRLAGAQGNAFGIAFRNAAEEIGAEFFHELFESSRIVLEASAENSFMVRLTEKL